MADLLDGLEVGISRNVGAASRIRAQITSIDEFMAQQRQSDLSLPHVTYPTLHHPPSIPNTLNPTTALPSITKLEQNPNIDPSLQNAISAPGTGSPIYGPGANGAGTMGGPPPNLYGYASAVNGIAGPVHASEQGQFQLPQELLDQWPWNVDITQGFTNF
jgi:hypothetical protein